MNKILKKWIFVLSMVTIVSCSSHLNGDLTLTLANQHINYVDSSLTNNYRSYRNDTIRKNATNVITYTISNPTDKKYLLVFDTDSPEPVCADDHVRPLIGYRIVNNKNVLKKCYSAITDAFLSADVLDCRDCIAKNRIDEYYKVGVTEEYLGDVYNYLHNAVTIYPGEKRTFKSAVMLPIYLEHNPLGGLIVSHNGLQTSDRFQLIYHCNAAHLRAQLPKYILDELEYNKIEIFDGQVRSNKIPLKMIK